MFTPNDTENYDYTGIPLTAIVPITVNEAPPEPGPEPEPEPKPTQTFYTVTFDGNGGTVSGSDLTISRTVSGGDAVGELPVATRADHSFNGWFTEKDGGESVSEKTTVESDITFYTGWTADPKPQTTSHSSPTYTITELGANGIWMKGSPFGLTIICNGDISKFSELQVGGQAVHTDHYTKEAGSTKITLKLEYLETLAIRTYTATLVYNDGSVSTAFAILAAKSPKTDDRSNLPLYLWITVLSATSIMAIIITKRRMELGKADRNEPTDNNAT